MLLPSSGCCVLTVQMDSDHHKNHKPRKRFSEFDSLRRSVREFLAAESCGIIVTHFKRKCQSVETLNDTV
jgi:hypothetical protein